MTQEIYALTQDRSASFAIAFLDNFLPQRQAIADECPVPECSDNPIHVFTTTEEILKFLEANPEEGYGLYWNSCVAEGTIRQAMLFYTIDNHLILGLASSADDQSLLFDELLQFAGTKIGLLGSEQRPPETAREFEAMARRKGGDPGPC